MSKSINVPKLRFKEFSGEWEEKTLGEISSKVLYGIGSSAIVYDGVNKYLRITDIDESSRTFIPNPLTSPSGDIEEKYKLVAGDLVFARTGASTGKSYLYNEKDGNLIYAGFLIKFHIDKANPYFVYKNTFKEQYYKWVQIMSMRSGQPGINAEEYKLLPLFLPSKQEQEKIASFLISTDTKIEQLTKKEELLQQYKKGVMQKIFNQEIRFKDDDGSEFCDWEEKKLDDVLKTVSTKLYQIKNSDILSEGLFKVVDQGQKTIAGYSNDTEKVYSSGDIIVYGDHTTIVKYIDFDFIVGADGTKLLNTTKDNNLKYMYYNLVFNNIEAEGYKRHFSILRNITLQIPSLKEQIKIANFLSSIDSKIEQVQKQLNFTKEFKKALLQKMFI